jgi:hypothetical protein
VDFIGYRDIVKLYGMLDYDSKSDGRVRWTVKSSGGLTCRLSRHLGIVL